MKILPILLCSMMLFGCGGGGSGGGGGVGSDGAAVNAVPASTASGRAIAGGQSAASAQVILRDANRRESRVMTLADGSFNVDFAGLTYPALIKVVIPNPATGQLTTLYGALVAAPSGRVLITGLSTAVVSGLANGEPDVMFEALGTSASAAAAITSARISAAEQAIRARLPTLATAEFLGQALPPASGFLFALLDGAIAGLEDFLKKVSSMLTVASLGGAVTAAIEPLKVGCDVTALARLADGSLRPECEATPNRPVTETVAGRLAPLERARPANRTARADELAGVDRGNNWKFFKPNVTAAQLVATLKPKLKSKIEDIWSGNKGILFPESLGIDSRSTEELVTSIIDIDWRLLGKRLRVADVSNITFEYQMLRQRLGDPESAQRLFSPIAVNAVSLANTNGIDPRIELTPFGLAIETFARSWLRDGSNRNAGASVATAVTALDDLVNQIMGQSTSDVLQLRAGIDSAANALPSGYATLARTAKDVATWHVDFYGCTILPTFDADIACRQVAINRLPAVLSAYADALVQARSTASSSTTETAGQFYDRFLMALAVFINESYELRFEAASIDDTYGGVGYNALVITAELRDTVGTACCFTLEKYWNAERAALVYRVPGEAVRFQPMTIEPGLGEAMAGGLPVMIAPIVRQDFAAPPISARSGSVLIGPLEVVNTAPGFLMMNAWVVALACSAADTACMSRLARSRVLHPADTIVSGTYHFGFGVLSNSIREAGGIQELSFPIDVR